MKLTATHPETVISKAQPPYRQRYRNRNRTKPVINTITLRQAEVLRLIMQGLANKQIADQLGICEQTVEKHRYAVYEKAGINTTAQAVHLGITLGLGPLIRFPAVQLSPKACSALVTHAPSDDAVPQAA